MASIFCRSLYGSICGGHSKSVAPSLEGLFPEGPMILGTYEAFNRKTGVGFT